MYMRRLATDNLKNGKIVLDMQSSYGVAPDGATIPDGASHGESRRADTGGESRRDAIAARARMHREKSAGPRAGFDHSK